LTETIGQILPLAVAAGLSPIPIVAIVALLATPGAKANSTAFIAGWVLGLGLLGAVLLLLLAGATEASSGGSPTEGVSWVKLALGVALLALALSRFRRRFSRSAKPKEPAWMNRIDSFGWKQSTSLGFGLSALNPKNVFLMAAAVASIAGAGESLTVDIASLLVYIAIATLGIAGTVAVAFAAGDRSDSILTGIRDWMVKENDTVIAIIALLIGVQLIGDALPGTL
jgi:hypothetical protein